MYPSIYLPSNHCDITPDGHEVKSGQIRPPGVYASCTFNRPTNPTHHPLPASNLPPTKSTRRWQKDRQETQRNEISECQTGSTCSVKGKKEYNTKLTKLYTYTATSKALLTRTPEELQTLIWPYLVAAGRQVYITRALQSLEMLP